MKTLLMSLLLLINGGMLNHEGKPSAKLKSLPLQTLKVDVAASAVNWHITKLIGEHTGTLKVYWGQLTLKDDKLNGGAVLVDMNTLEVTDLEQPDKRKLEANLKSDNFFDAGRFTVARFDIVGVRYQSLNNREIKITGTLTMHGITRNIEFGAAILKNTSGDFIARADIKINRRDWRIATANFKYDHFISPVIALHILLRASAQQTASL